jgi:nucleoside permease NupC
MLLFFLDKKHFIKNIYFIRSFNNVFEAISVGAIDMIKVIGAILANLIAFISIFTFLDNICIWLFKKILIDQFGLASILSYLFWPFAFLMGVEYEDCLSVAKLVGYKVFVNEFVAYKKLGNVINLRQSIIANNTLFDYKNGTKFLPQDMSYMIWNVFFFDSI